MRAISIELPVAEVIACEIIAMCIALIRIRECDEDQPAFAKVVAGL